MHRSSCRTPSMPRRIRARALAPALSSSLAMATLSTGAAACRTRSFSDEARPASIPPPEPTAPTTVTGVVPVTDWGTAIGAVLAKHPKITVLGLGETTHSNGEFNAMRFAAWEGVRASHVIRSMFLEECLTGSWRIHTRKKDPKVTALSLLDEFDRTAFANEPFLTFLEKARGDKDLRMRSAPLVVGVDPQGIFRCDPNALHEIFAPYGAPARNAVDYVLAFAKRYADPDATLVKLAKGGLALETIEGDFASYESAVEVLEAITAKDLRPDVSADITPAVKETDDASIEIQAKKKQKDAEREGPAQITSPYSDLDEAEVARAFARVAVVQLRFRLSFFSPFTEEFRLLRRPAFTEEQKATYDRAYGRASDRLHGPLTEAARDEGMAHSIVAWQEALGPARAKGIFWAHAGHVARGTFGASGPGTPLGFLRAGGHLEKLVGDAYMGLAIDAAKGRFDTLRFPNSESLSRFPEVRTRPQVEAFLAAHKETCDVPPRAKGASPLRTALEKALGEKGARGALFTASSDVVAAQTEYEMLLLGATEGACAQVLAKPPFVRFRLGEQFDGLILLPSITPARIPLGPKAVERYRAKFERARTALSPKR